MVEDGPVLVPLEDLAKKPYRELLGYPNASDESAESRLRQLKSLGLQGLEFEGPLKMGKLSVLGKGVVGLVFRGIAENRRVAVKIRRTDSRRRSMIHESAMMRAANKAGIGPECLGSTEDVLEMQFLEGQRLPLWISSLKGRGRKVRVKATVKAMLEQCVRLDAYGLDHGELSRTPCSNMALTVALTRTFLPRPFKLEIHSGSRCPSRNCISRTSSDEPRHSGPVPALLAAFSIAAS